MQEARIRAFTGVGRENLDLLLEAVLSIPGETNRKREILSAAGRLATDEDRDLVCSMLCSNIDVLPIILDRGWQDHAQEIILQAAVANPYTMGAPWVEYLLGVDDPRAEDSVGKRVVLGEWSPHLYVLVVEAGIDLSDRIEQQWQAAKLVGDDRGLLIALRSGYPGALRRIAAFREDEYLRDKVRRKVLRLMRERSPFDGENEDFLPWLKERHVFLTFDEKEQAYVFNGGIQ